MCFSKQEKKPWLGHVHVPQLCGRVFLAPRSPSLPCILCHTHLPPPSPASMLLLHTHLFCDVDLVQAVASLCEGAPTHARRLKKSHFMEQVLSIVLGMMGEHEEDPKWESREEIDQDEDEDDSTNRGFGEEVLIRLAEVGVSGGRLRTPPHTHTRPHTHSQRAFIFFTPA